MVGQIVGGKYELVRHLGEGGMGVVYEARQIETDERVAIKLLDFSRHKRDDQRLNRFYREARATSAVDSEHVLKVFDAGEDEATSVSWIVMELLHGEDLDHLLRRVPVLSPAVALKIAAQVCAGLCKAHEVRVIHRDIKPANLFLVRCGNGEVVVKILDFGIAKTKAEPGTDTTGLTRSGSVIGSPLFMSPEQARGLKDISFPSDIWSLGVVL